MAGTPERLNEEGNLVNSEGQEIFLGIAKHYEIYKEPKYQVLYITRHGNLAVSGHKFKSQVDFDSTEYYEECKFIKLMDPKDY